jgi:Protein of unknown function (DUF2793)
MSSSTNLALPYLEASQAQKHVTVNEALARLDALVHLAVLSRAVVIPPATPLEGERYLVPPAATGVWTTQIGKLALWLEGTWVYATPREGWQLWVSDENLLLTFDGAAWVASSVPTTLQNLQLLGINATADATNKFSIASAASLFNHAGNGHQIKLNKNVPADTASMLWQTGFSGRAEIGTTGDNAFHLKVSANGTDFKEVLVADPALQGVRFPDGVTLLPQVDPISPVDGAIWHDTASSSLKTKLAGVVQVIAPPPSSSVTANAMARGVQALAKVPAVFALRKAVIIDCSSNGLAQLDDSLGHDLRTLEGLPGLVFTNATGGKRISRKKRFENIGANALRYSHTVDGTPLGILIEASHNYANRQSQPTIAQCDEALSTTDTVAPTGWSGTWTAFGDNTIVRTRRNLTNYTTGSDLYLQCLVRMTDGLAPVANDFDFSFAGLGVKHPDTAAAGLKITGPFLNDVYLVQAFATATATISGVIGVAKTTTNTVKTFSLGPWNYGPGRYPPSLFDNVTAAPNNRTADVLKLPVSGFDFNSMTLFGEFLFTNDMPSDGYVAQVLTSNTARLQAFKSGTNAMQFAYYNGTTFFGPTVSALVHNTRYKFAVAMDAITGKVRAKLTGLAAATEIATLPKTTSGASVRLVIGSNDGNASWANTSINMVGLDDRSWTATEILAFTG